MEISLSLIMKWLTGSGLKVNEQKTDLCLFYKKDCTPVGLIVGDVIIRSNKRIMVLGVLFDCKLQWVQHVSQAFLKANSALNAIKIIKKYFTKEELLGLLTSNFYSKLYYNSEIWLIDNLNPRCKQMLLSASAKALKICMFFPDPELSFLHIHDINNRAMPHAFMPSCNINTHYCCTEYTTMKHQMRNG